jgi:tripartite-type tricarboxylate transporter receptor subunit TctC
MRVRFTSMALAIMGLTTVLSGPALSADFYKGKTVRVIIGYSPGGGYDTYARIMARELGKYLPGNPRVISQNMTGAGSLKAANYIYNNAPKDGTVFGTFGRSMPLLPLLAKTKARFDSTKFTWIGTPASYADDAYLLLIRSDNPVKNIGDIRKKGGEPLILGTTAIGSTGTDIPLVLRNVLGLNLKLLSGYPGGVDINLAIERKEVYGRMLGMSSLKGTKRAWIKDRKIMRPILQFARQTRHPELLDVPLATELAINPEDKALIEMMQLPFLMARPFAAPPGLPPGRTKILREAFFKAVNSKEYRGAAGKLGMDVSPKSGKQVAAMVKKMYALPNKLIRRYEGILANPGMQKRTVTWITESGKITKLAKKNRRITFDFNGKARQAKVAGSGYTAIKVKGKKAKRSKLKVGMSCAITYEGHKTAAQKVDCK